MREHIFTLVGIAPLVAFVVYYLASKPWTCRRCRGHNFNLKIGSYRCKHCGVRFY